MKYEHLDLIVSTFFGATSYFYEDNPPAMAASGLMGGLAHNCKYTAVVFVLPCRDRVGIVSRHRVTINNDVR